MRARLILSCCILSGFTPLTLVAAGDTAAQTPRWTTREVLRLGTVDGPAALSNVFDAEFAPDGRILVSQRDAGLAEFGPDGGYRRTVGRQGPGPGEFTFMSRLGWKGDTLWAVDFNRLNLFRTDLAFARTIAPMLDDPPPAIRTIPGPLMVDGSLLFVPLPSPDGSPTPIILTDRAGSRIRVLAREMDQQRQWLIRPTTGLPITTFDPWPSHTLWLHDPDGRSITVVDRRNEDASAESVFHIIRIALSGDTIARAAIRYVPREISDDMADTFFRRRAEALSDRPGLTAGAAESMLRDVVELAAHVPPVTKLVLASDGTTWLRREDTPQETVEWQVLDRDFMEVAWLTLPADLEVFRITGSRLLGRVRDELDIPFVVVHEIRRERGQQNEP